MPKYYETTSEGSRVLTDLGRTCEATVKERGAWQELNDASYFGKERCCFWEMIVITNYTGELLGKKLFCHTDFILIARHLLILVTVALPIAFHIGLTWAGPPFFTDDPEPVEYKHW